MRPPLPAYLCGRECDSASDLVLIEGMARRFHESALSLRYPTDVLFATRLFGDRI